MAQKNKPDIKVTVHYPEKVNEALKQEKINYLYDLLKPRDSKIKE